MALKKVKTDVITKDLTISYNTEVTAFKTSKKGTILFKLPITMLGAWSDRRVAKAIYMAYIKGFEAASSDKGKARWIITPKGEVVKEVQGVKVPLDIKDAKGIIKKVPKTYSRKSKK